MRLPFAVYTARQGYAWQSGAAAGTARLDKYRKAIGKAPDFDLGDSASCGILNVDDEVVLYRYMLQKNADFKGRDAVYLALTYFTRRDARFVNADSILRAFPFAEPLTDPPDEFDYNGAAAVPTDFSIPTETAGGCFSKDGSLASAGCIFEKPFDGILHISRAMPGNGDGAIFRYQPARKTHMVDPSPAQIPTVTEPELAAHETSSSTLWKWIACAAIAVAILEAAALYWLLRAKDAGDIQPVNPPPEVVIIPDAESLPLPTNTMIESLNPEGSDQK